MCIIAFDYASERFRTLERQPRVLAAVAAGVALLGAGAVCAGVLLVSFASASVQPSWPPPGVWVPLALLPLIFVCVVMCADGMVVAMRWVRTRMPPTLAVVELRPLYDGD